MAYELADIENLIKVYAQCSEMMNKMLKNAIADKAALKFVFPTAVYPEVTVLGGLPVIHGPVQDICLLITVVNLP